MGAVSFKGFADPPTLTYRFCILCNPGSTNLHPKAQVLAHEFPLGRHEFTLKGNELTFEGSEFTPKRPRVHSRGARAFRFRGVR